MGEPVKFLTLAENLIRLSDYTPYDDIKIEFSRLRPGEKMYEELILNHDNSLKTDNEKIFVEKPESFTSDYIDTMLTDLKSVSEDGGDVRAVLKKYIPTYQMKG